MKENIKSKTLGIYDPRVTVNEYHIDHISESFFVARTVRLLISYGSIKISR
jgi:hypothetical protein